MSLRVAAQILWPAFLAAGVIELLVFGHVDPGDLHTLGGGKLELSPQAIYTLAFFAFWAVCAAAGWLSWLLLQREEEVNRGG